MGLRLRLRCLQNSLVHQTIQFQTRLEVHADGYDARCVGTYQTLISLKSVLGCLSTAIRQELATREHMLDHGQLGPATPVSPAGSPVASRRPSDSSQAVVSRRPSGESAPRRPSRLSFSSTFGESLSMSSIEPKINHPLHTIRNMSTDPTTETSALDIEDESETELNGSPAHSSSTKLGFNKQDVSIDAAQKSSIQLSDAIATDGKGGDTTDGAPLEPPTTHFTTPSDLASQLLTNPKLAGLRLENLPVSAVNSPPILLNAKCSGYFVEPVGPRMIADKHHPYFRSSLHLDEMDGTLPFRRSNGGEDNMS